MTADLVAFLRARLDEEEQVAQACAGDGKWTAADIEIIAPDLGPEVRAHIARHDPARVLADIAAKRRLVDEFAQTGAVPDTPERRGPHWRGDFGYLQGLARAVHLLALPYADHPGYRQKWKP